MKYEKINDKLVNPSTGEIIDSVTVTIPLGSKVITPDQQRARAEYAKKLSRQDEHFYFILHQHQLNQISAESTGRLIYLLTYLDYDGKLRTSERKQMTKKDLPEVLKVSKRTVDTFWSEVKEKYLREENGFLVLNCDDVVKGKLPTKEKYQKFNAENIRKLYENTPKTKHKHLGYAYQLLPFINLEFNVICSNPYEVDLYEINALTSTEFCHEIGYEESNFCKLRKIYSEITFEVKNRQEHLLIYTSATGERNDFKIVVNPNILYNGHNFEKVEAFGFLAVCKKKSK